MRKAMFLAVLVFASCAATATVGIKRNWASVFDDDDATTYVFPSSIHRQGDKATMWSLVSFKAPQRTSRAKVPFMSEKSAEEYDCQERRFRTLSYALHRETMGVGETVYAKTAPDQWQEVLPDSDIEILWKVACGVIKANAL